MAALRETPEQALERWEDLEALQEHYRDFRDFLNDVQHDVYGWETTDIQFDIGDFLQHGGRYIMIQAQRGQAKTTITAIFAVWCLIMNPKTRVVILSAGGDMANEIATGIVKIILSMDILTCIRPDQNCGDRTSTKAFDIHYTLRGEGMNPSVKCMGITANMQGTRADLLIADDIESSKNAQTQVQREHLLSLTRDFTSICSEGRIVYLGTPQSVDSIYNSLPGRGYTIRVWPGRYPTLEEEKDYGANLAPLLVQRIALDGTLRTGGGILGDVGKPVDNRLHEMVLQAKELDQGPAYFKLQHMLSTKLSDSERFPLKLRNAMFMHLNPEEAPGKVVWQPRPELRIPMPQGSLLQEELYRPFQCVQELFPYGGRMMYVDPAGGGQNGDETAAAVSFFLHGMIFVMEVRGLPGGIRDDVFTTLSSLAWKYQVNVIQVEKNFGNGAFAQAWRPTLNAHYKEASGGQKNSGPMIEDIWESGQKELRIIDVLEPVMARHCLIFNESILQEDVLSTQKYPMEKRGTYQLMHQISRITRDKGALIHDDRIDALAASVRYWIDRINQDADQAMAQKMQENVMEFFRNPFGHAPRTGVNVTAFDRYQPKYRR